ncbi:hypothetical protein JOC78_003134 [Bacillus ectoiniformans]|uniref:sporulation inhibitor of replication protein SirA n=1 Tax=Bacillus ectoiniformans TaxID=1494429 RepID=UPI00195AC831|nr:sporulation inhibitor of replication protein SirA [Bacillus ectoiniformans]MBM7650150.1 hypothetical protein [Bacillus ectoiniformans]
MRSYQIYWIREEFANYFYGRERNFYQLFFDGCSSENEKQTIVDKQICYITKRFEVEAIENILLHSLAESNRIRKADDGSFKLQLSNGKGEAILYLQPKSLLLQALGSYETEAVIFHALKKLDDCLFAVDFERKNYGWLKPVKKELLLN